MKRDDDELLEAHPPQDFLQLEDHYLSLQNQSAQFSDDDQEGLIVDNDFEEVKASHQAVCARAVMTQLPPDPTYSRRLEKVLTSQSQFLSDLQKKKVTFANLDKFQKRVIDKLNEIARQSDVRIFFSHNGRDGNKYISLKCQGCEHAAFAWFDYKRDSTTGEIREITFNRFPYGVGMHSNVKTHLPGYVRPSAKPKGGKQAPKRDNKPKK